jgi:hypothetical protein
MPNGRWKFALSDGQQYMPGSLPTEFSNNPETIERIPLNGVIQVTQYLVREGPKKGPPPTMPCAPASG